jgi:PncC family amidohydrolase
MMMHLCCDVLKLLEGKTLVTAESCTGGGIGAALTAVPGSSKVYKGGIISYTNEVKIKQLQVSAELLDRVGAVSAEVAKAMAIGARTSLSADVAVSVTGLAGPDGDDRGNPVGTVYVGYADQHCVCSKEFHFSGGRDSVRNQAVEAALSVVLENYK